MRSEGATFEQHKIGDVHRTLGRTVSETDIVNFVNLCGFTEPLFMDMEYVKRESVFGRRAAPGALTFALSEGLIMQTGLIHGTGMAFLGGTMKVVAPVLEGDTIRVEVEITDKRETKKTDRGIVTYVHRILNPRDEVVLEATSQRMIRRGGACGTPGRRGSAGGGPQPDRAGRRCRCRSRRAHRRAACRGSLDRAVLIAATIAP